MADPKRSIYWDSCTFVSFIDETAGRTQDLRAIMEEARNKEVVIYTSAISITEVAFKTAEQSGGLDREVEDKIDKLWHPSSPVRVVDYSRLVAYDARELLRKKLELGFSLKPLDAIHIATAIRAKVDELQTYDAKLKKWGEPLGLKITEPKPFQMLLTPADARPRTEEQEETRP